MTNQKTLTSEEIDDVKITHSLVLHFNINNQLNFKFDIVNLKRFFLFFSPMNVGKIRISLYSMVYGFTDLKVNCNCVYSKENKQSCKQTRNRETFYLAIWASET